MPKKIIFVKTICFMPFIEIKEITYKTKRYEQVVALREKILRKPIHKSLKPEDLQYDPDEYIFAAIYQNEVVGCVQLRPLKNKLIKLRQMAVDFPFQKIGIGKLLMEAAEQKARQTKHRKIILHARQTAVDFYQKLNYHIVSDAFIEIGIFHYKMEKTLQKKITTNY